MFKHKRTTLERIEKFISPLYFTDVNLRGQLYGGSRPLDVLQHINCGQDRPSFEDVISPTKNSKLHSKYGAFSDTSIGRSFGPTWATHWFKVKATIPKEWLDKEVHLRFDAGCEALIWSEDGTPLQGLSGAVHERTDFTLPPLAVGKDGHLLYIEMACNTAFGAGANSMIGPPDPNKSFTLKTAEIALFHRDVFQLLLSLNCLYEMANELPETNPRSFDALYAGNDMINVLQRYPGEKGKEEAKAISDGFFSKKNGETQHQIVAIGHCHIDCAWLWPYNETIRKCARSWSSTVQLMERFPNFKFACSQAQQFEWVKLNYPGLYEKIKIYVNEGRFIPVGGTWVEMDGNIPSGESFIRQFLYGQRYFREEFGKTCREFWLPDTFGYSPQLPQIMKECGIDRFLTQKLSWSLVNKFPHHNFLWEGIDGTKVITYFPPGDSYEMKVEVKEAVKQVSNLKDKGRVSQSLMLFGYGDGGGGPIEDMILRQEILQDVDGIAKIKMGTPSEVFEHLSSRADKLCIWKGELYLELHNGTYTSQARMKDLNRKCEFLTRDVEFLQAISYAECRIDNVFSNLVKAEVFGVWKNILLNQFHDVLPGSSIGEVHKDAVDLYMDSIGKLEAIKMRILECAEKEAKVGKSVLNTLPWDRESVISVPMSWLNAKQTKYAHLINDGRDVLLPIRLPSMGSTPVTNSIVGTNIVTLELRESETAFVLKNQYIEAVIGNCGKLLSLKLSNDDREALSSVGNYFSLFDDIPLYWDAWDVMDYHLETRKDAITQVIQTVKVVETGPHRVSLTYVVRIGRNSKLTQIVSLDSTSPYLKFDTEVEWHESHQFLKVEFPVGVHSQNATYEIQFGHLQRPTHYNTSWDWARFEVCGHKWVDLSEFGYGVSLLNTNKYGHSVRDNVLTLSLLRAPKSPDDNADMGTHRFTYAIMPHKNTFQESDVIRRAYELNCEPMLVDAFFEVGKSWFQVDNSGVILETVKLSEDEANNLVLRFYESFGSHCQATVTSPLRAKAVRICNALEEAAESKSLLSHLLEPSFELKLYFKPFQIVTISVTIK